MILAMCCSHDAVLLARLVSCQRQSTQALQAISRTGIFFASHPVTRSAPSKAWARWLFWQVRSRLRREIVVNWIEDQKLAVRRDMTGPLATSIPDSMSSMG